MANSDLCSERNNKQIEIDPAPLSFFGQALNNTSEQSEVSLFCVVMRSFTSVQDDKFAKNVNIGSTAISLPK